jgi:hypothetical protein
MVAHASCLTSYGQEFDIESWTFLCIEHATGSEAVPPMASIAYDNCTIEQKCQRLGIPFHASRSNRSLNNHLQKCLASLVSCNVPLPLISSLKNSHPQPFPNIIKMKENVEVEAALYGRRFEVSMLQYVCKTCSCCGFTSPVHCDTFYPADSVDGGAFQHSHLTMNFHDAWECNCMNVCGGQQFYGARRPTIMESFSSLHGNQSSHDVIGSQCPNATLCNNCYYEFKHQRDGERNNLTDGESSFSYIALVISSTTL